MIYLITGAAGFIGFHLTKSLLERGEIVIGIDNLNDYYSVDLKKARCYMLQQFKNFSFYSIDITNQKAVQEVFDCYPKVDYIIHLAAQAGVRYSLENPYTYLQTNVMGQLIILEQARKLKNLKRIFYASSSSVYGLNKKIPFNEQDRVDQPSSVYAASKRSAELLSFSYSHIYGLKQTGLRFFTVYGPWGRPDMAYYLFAQAICLQKPITLYSGNQLSRDFTYIDDVVNAILVLIENKQLQDYDLFNIGNSHQERVDYLITCLEKSLDIKAIINYVKRPDTDIESTLSDIHAIHQLTGWSPKINLCEGSQLFVEWFKHYNGLS